MCNSLSPSSELTIESKASELRKTGINVIDDIPWGTHFCCFYETKADLLETLVSYFKEGLAHHEFCLWVVSQALTLEEAKCALGQAVPDLERHLAAGVLEIHSQDKWYLRDGAWDPQRVLQSWREKLNQALAKGYVGFRGAGDGGWIQNEGWTAFRDYEKQVNGMIADQRSIILCTYPLTTSPGHQVFDVAHIHQAAMARRNGNWEVIETSALKEAKSEIKRLNDELERRVEERTRELATANEALRSEIAERKLMEESVKQAEDRIRLIIDTIPTMAWSLRPDGVVDFVNQRWVDYTGVSFQDAIREPNGIVHPEDLPGVVQNWLGDMAAGKPSEDEMRLRRRDGKYRWFLVRTVPLRDKKGDIIKWYGTSSDIEDRKQAEMQSRTLLDVIPHQIWSGPADGSLDYCNDRWRAYVGLDQENLWGDGWQSMLHPDDRDRVLEAWRASVASGTPYEQEERHRGADGTYRWFLALGLPQRDAEGRVVKWYGTNTDIEERKQAQEALRESEERFRSYFELGLIGTAITSPTKGWVEINDEICRILGYERSELLRMSWAELTHPDDLAADVGHFNRVLAGEIDGYAMDKRFIRKDGRLIDAAISVKCLRRADGAVDYFVALVQDITERKQAEEALAEQAVRYKTLMETSADSIYILNEEGDLKEANAAFLHRRGYTVAEAASLHVADWDAQWTREQLQQRLRTWVDGGSVFETQHRCKDGSVFDVEACVTRVRIGGQSLFFCVARDITERARFRQIAENINEVFWVWTATSGNAQCLYVSPAYETIWGRSCETLYASPRSWMEALHPHDKERVHEEGARMDFEKITDWTYRIVRPDQSIRWIRDRIFPVRDVRGAVVRFAGIAEDITESKEAEEAVRKANRQLRVLSRRRIQEQEDERRRLSRELHDQIGQSLTAAKINVEALRSTKNPALVGRIDETAAILDQLLGQVRQISLDLRPPMLDDLGLVPALRSFIDEQGRRASVAVRFSAEHVPEKLDPEIQITCFRIAQEAITNAVRHAKATQLEIALRCARGKTLRLLARDNGIGFDAQLRQAQAVDLGLIGIRERAALVGGRVKIISSPRQGTTIDVSLPLTLRPERQSRQTGK